MSWTAPTPADFILRFPVFSTVDPDTIQMILDEAIAEVGESWIERDRTPAVLYLTAHLMTSQGVGASGPGDGGVAVSGAVKRRKVGDVEVEFAGLSGSSASGTSVLDSYRSTTYGQRYLLIMRRNFPAVAVV